MPALSFVSTFLLVLAAAPATAHDLSGVLNSTWSYDPWLLTPLYVVGISFYVGTQRIWQTAGFGHGVQVRQVAAFWTGWLVLGLAITSPLHWLGERLFSAHMIEHELMMMVSAPLMAYARINGAMLWSLPRGWRPAAGRVLTSGVIGACWCAISHPVTATALHGLALWLWHALPFYRLALENVAAHRLQHITFFLTALLFWWVLFYGRGTGRSMRIRDGISVACLFVTVLHSGLLGALLTLSPRVWFPQQGLLAADFGLTPLEDQQLAGLVMWIPMGTLYTCAGLFFAHRWLSRSSRTAAARLSGTGTLVQ
ncbi:cytochrome c oxidase assembly protein [Bradyrhizobium australiense]|uniref:Cytochrome c oxidase assembly protein n=1 Tax=Bradyrhizobium australiense TaxID=2721161 RepID=A0A7Y4GMB5_9BRAD|nr:cytochrome c oxidase assembly protein [Bradyrhizobium australiense]NOJ38418.1 cytochrome c oxidase assembly protein [Bradyrhizobium australiense]